MNKKSKFVAKTPKEYDIERIAEELDKSVNVKIKKLFEEEGPEYFIGVDRYKDNSSYCLLKSQRRISKVVLSKNFITETVESRKRFDEEVKNLSQIFNAKILEDN